MSVVLIKNDDDDDDDPGVRFGTENVTNSVSTKSQVFDSVQFSQNTLQQGIQDHSYQVLLYSQSFTQHPSEARPKYCSTWKCV